MCFLTKPGPLSSSLKCHIHPRAVIITVSRESAHNSILMPSVSSSLIQSPLLARLTYGWPRATRPCPKLFTSMDIVRMPAPTNERRELERTPGPQMLPCERAQKKEKAHCCSFRTAVSILPH